MASVPGPYLNSDKSSFAYTSVTKRWPAIIQQIADDLNGAEGDERAAEERPKLTDLLFSLKQDLETDAVISHLPAEAIDSEIYNSEIDAYQESSKETLKWHSAPWLLSECYLYRKIQHFFDSSKYWKSYDMFGHAKNTTFTKSSDAVSSLADRYVKISEQLGETLKGADHATKVAALELLFHELLSTSLWGNATDLSLLVTVSLEELKKLQVAAESRDKEMLLANDFEAVWKQLNSQVGGRVDIVLDNSGFELYTDLVLTLFLLDSNLAEQVVLHPKSQPWFVSDVVPRDFGSVISMLADEKVFPEQRNALNSIVEKLTNYMNDGSIVIRTSTFWTTSLPFWEIKENGKAKGDQVWRDFRASKLVIFKGDLNYRKLTGDVMWNRDTPFTVATQDLAHANIPIVSLRTVKADVCVGLPEGKGASLAAKWKSEHPDQPEEAWSWSGSYAVISALTKS